MILGRTKICDIDMLLIVGTSSLFNNAMQTAHELMTLLPLHWANITLLFDLVYVVTLLMVLVLKKGNYCFKHGSTRSYYMCKLIDLLPHFKPNKTVRSERAYDQIWQKLYARLYLSICYPIKLRKSLKIRIDYH